MNSTKLGPNANHTGGNTGATSPNLNKDRKILNTSSKIEHTRWPVHPGHCKWVAVRARANASNHDIPDEGTMVYTWVPGEMMTLSDGGGGHSTRWVSAINHFMSGTM